MWISFDGVLKNCLFVYRYPSRQMIWQLCQSLNLILHKLTSPPELDFYFTERTTLGGSLGQVICAQQFVNVHICLGKN